jgi:hypothetical protein
VEEQIELRRRLDCAHVRVLETAPQAALPRLLNESFLSTENASNVFKDILTLYSKVYFKCEAFEEETWASRRAF